MPLLKPKYICFRFYGKIIHILFGILLFISLAENKAYTLSRVEIKYSKFTDKGQLRVSIDGSGSSKMIWEEESYGLDYALPFRDSYYFNFLFTRWLFNRTIKDASFERDYARR
jgi:hypothetical protein